MLSVSVAVKIQYVEVSLATDIVVPEITPLDKVNPNAVKLPEVNEYVILFPPGDVADNAKLTDVLALKAYIVDIVFQTGGLKSLYAPFVNVPILAVTEDAIDPNSLEIGIYYP